MAEIAARRSGGWAVPNGLERVVESIGIMSWRYFVVWIPSSFMNVVIHSSMNVESRGYGKEADVKAEAGVDELM